MITEEGRKCDVKDCKGIGVHYGMDDKGNYGDLCEQCFVIYNYEVLRGSTPKPYIECWYCEKKVYMLPAQFTKTMALIDNREKKREFTPRFACPHCSRRPGFLSTATTSAGKIIFAEAMADGN